MNRFDPIAVLICAMTTAIGPYHLAAASGQTATVAITGDALPQGNGSIDDPLTPAINNDGQMVFPSFLSTVPIDARIDTGVYLASPSGGPLTQVVRENDLTPDATRRFSTVFLSPAFNDAGQMAFLGLMRPLVGGFSDDNGIFRGSGGALTQIVRQGQASPDGDGTFGGMLGQTSTSFSSPSLNASGQAAFHANLVGTTNSTGLFRGSGGALTQMVRQGQSAPDGDGTFASFTEPALNNAGQAAFTAQLNGTTNPSGVFLGSGGTLTQIARTGQAAPDGDGTLSSFFVHNVNNAGQAAFIAAVTGTNSRGVFVGSGGSLTQVARTGQSAPDGDGTFRSFLSLSLNDAGQTTFVGFMDGSTNDTGVFLSSNGTVQTLARNGQTAPNGDGQFGDLTPAATSLNNNGQAAFTGVVTATNDGSDDEGIFMGDGIELIQVARQGQLRDGSAIVDLAALNNSGALGGQSRRGLNDLGQVAYRARLADDRTGIFLFTPQLNWRPNSSGNWDDNANWTLSLNPAAPHEVAIRGANGVSVTGPSVPTTVKTLSIGTATEQGSLDLVTDGKLTITQDMTLVTDATLGFEIDGALSDQFAQVDVLGTAALDGTLNIALNGGFNPNVGDVFPIITAGTRAGEFDQIKGHILSSTLALGQFYSDTGDVLRLLATAPGDANGDLVVDAFDFGLLAGNFNLPGTWETGDFDGSGVTDAFDFGLLAANFNGDFNALAAAAATLGITAIPEPATAAVLSLMGVVVLGPRTWRRAA